MFRLYSLLLIFTMALASSDVQVPAMQAHDLLLSSRSRHHHRRRSKSCKKKVQATATNASATGPGTSDGTSIICTDLIASDLPYTTDTGMNRIVELTAGNYFYLKVNGKYKKVLYTEADSNWAGDYTTSSVVGGGVLTFQSPSVSTSPVAEGSVSITNAGGGPGQIGGVVDGDHINLTFAAQPSTAFPGTNAHGLVTFVQTIVGGDIIFFKIGSESPIPDTVPIGTYYAFITNTDNTGTCPNGVLAIGLQDGEASSDNNLNVDTGDTLKLYFKSKNCGGKTCGSSGGRRKRRKRRRRHHSDVEGDEVEVGDLAEFEEDMEDNGEDGFAQFWADKEFDVNDDWEEEAEEEK